MKSLIAITVAGALFCAPLVAHAQPWPGQPVQAGIPAPVYQSRQPVVVYLEPPPQPHNEYSTRKSLWSPGITLLLSGYLFDLGMIASGYFLNGGDNGNNLNISLSKGDIVVAALPVIGPFIQIGQTHNSFLQGSALTLGLLQGVGAALIVLGIVLVKEEVVWASLPSRMTILPTISAHAQGLALGLSF